MFISYGEVQAAGPELERLLIVVAGFVATLFRWGPRYVDAAIVRVDHADATRTVVWSIEDADDAFWCRVERLVRRRSRARETDGDPHLPGS